MKKAILILIYFLLFARPANAALVSWWKMDEVSGTTVADSVGSNNGTASGATIVVGHEQKARSFDGLNDLVTISPYWSWTGAFTIEAWIYRIGDSGGSAGPILVGYNTVNGLRLGSDNKLYFVVWYGTGDSVSVVSNAVIPTNTWTHAIFRRDDSNVWRLFINGVQQSSSVTESRNAYTNLDRIGGVAGEFQDYFSGIIDEVKIYNHALTQAEITQAYWEGSHTRIR